jgi:tetratricopeptide (TPR) repeat protein
MILPLALAFTLTGRFKPITKVFLGYASVVMFAGIAATLSRGAWIATGVTLLVFFGVLMRQHGQRLAAVLFLILLLGGSAWFIKNLGALQRRIHPIVGETQLDNNRVELWQAASRIWQDHFWWGAGPAHFDVRFRAYRPDDIQMRPLYAHNDYLNTLADWGTTGMALILAVLACLVLGIIQGWKFVKRSNDLAAKQSTRSAFVFGAAFGLLAMLLHSFMDFNMHIPANAIVAITFMALISSHLRHATERYWFRIGWIGKLLLTACCAAIIAGLAWHGIRQGREHALLTRANKARDFAGKLAWLKAAHEIEPLNSETTYEIGETLRLASWTGVGNYRQFATEATKWFELGMKLNGFDPYNYVRCGMCLDWLDLHDDAAPFFQKALERDPKSYLMFCLMGWHYLESGDLPEAKTWFDRSVLQARWHPDFRKKPYQVAQRYSELVARRLEEKAAAPK